MARKRQRGDTDTETRLYCVCKQKNDPDKPMIECDFCKEWFHLTCVGIEDVELSALEEWFCKVCQDITLRNPAISKQGVLRLQGRIVPKEGWGLDFPLQDLDENGFSKMFLSQRNKKEGWILFREEKIKIVQGCLKMPYYFVHGECEAAMKPKTYSVHMCFVKSADSASYKLKWMYCDCPAGTDGHCKHGSAVIYYLLDVSRLGKTSLPETTSCTGKLQMWHVKKPHSDEPLLFNDITFVKHDPQKPSKKEVCSVSKTHDPLPGYAAILTQQNVKRLVSLFDKIDSDLPVIKSIKANNCLPVKPRESCDLDLASDLFKNICHRNSGNDRTIPMIASYIDQLNESEQRLYNELIKVNLEECIEIEKKTKFQSKTNYWYKKRALRVTSSIFGKLCKILPSTDPVKTFEQSRRQFTCRSVRHGLIYESVAVHFFLQKNPDVQITSPVGLVISPEIPFLGASPDRIAQRQSGDIFLIEVKCPHSLYEQKVSIANAIEGGKFFLKKSNSSDEVHLNFKHEYYYQVQGQLNICNLPYCEFVVFVPPDDMEVVKVVKDEQFFQYVLSKLCNIWFKHLCSSFVQALQM